MITRRQVLAGLPLAALAAAHKGRAGAAPLAQQAPATTFLPSPSSPLVALRLVFRAGSQDDQEGKEGLAALTAAMIAEGGTKELTYEQVLARFYPMATELKGSCHKEVSVFAGVVHRDNLEKYEALVSSMLTAPRFASEDFDRLRNQALDGLTKTLRGNNDEELGKWALQLALYPGHPYGHVDLGTVSGLKAITLDDV
jgi:zinc protease